MKFEKIKRWITIIGMGLCSIGHVLAQESNHSQGADAQRIQRLEEAVHQLQKQNEALQKEVSLLKEKQLDAGIKTPNAGDSKKPTFFVLPWGKESKLILGGFIQPQGEFGDVSSFEGRFSDGPNAIENRFRLRRARINVSGEFFEHFDFKLEGEFQQTDGTTINRSLFGGTDLFTNWNSFPEINVKVGQFKAPFGLEQLIPDTILYTVERSLVISALTPERQVGIQIWGKPLTNIAPEHKELLGYAIGMFNGNGRNIVVNDNGEFMYVGRVELTPFSGKLFNEESKWRLGGNGLYSRDGSNANLSPVGNLRLQTDGSLLAFSTHSPDERVAWGIDQRLTIGPFDLNAEYLAETISPTTASPNFARFTAHGYYIQGSYYFLDRKLQLVTKWESFDPDQVAFDDINSITGGLNYYINGDHVKLMLDYIHTWSDFRNRNSVFGKDEFDQMLLRLQLMF